MTDKINTPDVNEILRLLLQAFNDASAINKRENNEAIKKETDEFLESIEQKITKFFRNNIDRRKELRERALIEDMYDIYKIKAYI